MLASSSEEMTLEDYTQPFWVGHGNPRFPTALNGYLPALELKEEIPEDKPEESWNKRQWGIVEQLRSEQKNIRKLIYNTLKENKAKYASKRKTIDINKLSSIYRGGEGGGK